MKLKCSDHTFTAAANLKTFYKLCNSALKTTSESVKYDAQAYDVQSMTYCVA